MHEFTKYFPVIVLILSLSAHAQTNDQLRALDRKWADAMTHPDFSALTDLLSDDLTYTHSSGETQSKTEFMASIRNGELKYHSIEFETAVPRSYKGVAIISSHVRVKVTAGGHNVNLHACFLHVWVEHQGRWQMVAHQATKLD